MTSNTHFQLSSFVRFGADIDSRAAQLFVESGKLAGAAQGTLDQWKTKAVNRLDALDQKRQATYESSVQPFLQLYATAGKRLSDRAPQGGQASRFAANAPTLNAPGGVKSASKGIAAGAVTGIVMGAAIAMLAQPLAVELRLPIAIGTTIVAGTLLSMLAAYKTAKANYLAAIAYSSQAAEFDHDVKRFTDGVQEIAAKCDQAIAVIDDLASNTDKEEQKMRTVLTDTANAAVLLRQILEMPLLDGDGALLADVVNNLQKQKARIQELGYRIDTEPAEITQS